MLFSSKPKNPIKSLPTGYSEEQVIKEITRDVRLALYYEQDKDNELKKITSVLVLNNSVTFAKMLTGEFKTRYPDDAAKLDESFWISLEGDLRMGIFLSSQIYYRNKQLRGEVIKVPTGKEFETYYMSEIKKFDKSSKYADLLIPSYLFKVIKEVALMVFSMYSEDKRFSDISEKFKESFLIQYMHALGTYLASYLIQDSFT